MKDPRVGKINHALHDCYMSAFAMMFFQDPSLLEFQRRLQQRINCSNLKKVFHITSIPKDTQLRDLLDQGPIDPLEKMFSDLFAPLQRGKHLEAYQFLDSMYLMPLDGSQYFSSEKIHCPSCLVKKPEKGAMRYSHHILQAAIVHPDKRQVIPLVPEAIHNTDGMTKQDCEINAGKRLVKKIRKAHPKLKLIVIGDDLYSKQPFLNELKKANMSFILVAKPSDHVLLHEWVTELKEMAETSQHTFVDRKGRVHHYEWVNEIPLNGTKNASQVNYFEYHLFVKGELTYHNSWVTDIPISEHTIADLVKGGRVRWKVENEGFNTLKNQGYHIEHNFGHGKKNLSMVFFLLNVLAFFVHQILELTDLLYQRCRSTFSSRKEFWNQLRCTFRILLFNSFEQMVAYVLNPPEARPP